MISKESALSIRLKKDIEKKSDIGADETLKNIQMGPFTLCSEFYGRDKYC